MKKNVEPDRIEALTRVSICIVSSRSCRPRAWLWKTGNARDGS